MSYSEFRACLVISLVLIGISAFLGFKRYQFLQRGLHAQGTVVDQYKADEKSRTYYYPVVEFLTEKGEKVQFRSTERSARGPLIETESKVDVLYDPEEPAYAWLPEHQSVWAFPLALFGFSLFILVPSTLFYVYGNRS